MAIRLLGSLGTVALIGAAVLISHPVAGQEQGAAPPLVITAFGDKTAPPYAARRTSWGEPDLQGVWSSDDTAGIPMQRPEQFGNRLYLNEEEYAERAKQVESGVERAENEATSSFRQDFARRAFWQTSLIVDPADGRMPAYTPEGMTRPMPRGTYGNGPLDSYTDFSTYERCITRGIAGSSLRVVYGNGQRIVQAPGVVAISYEMIHDTRLIYTDGRPHINQAIRQYLGDSRAHWEGDELVVETTNLTDRTAIGLNGNGNRHSTQMKLTERFKRLADDILQYQTDRGRSRDLRAAVHDVVSANAARGRQTAALRLPRGQLRAASVARGRARRGPCGGGRQVEGNHSTAAARAGWTGRRRSASGRRRRNTGPVAGPDSRRLARMIHFVLMLG